MTDRPPFRHAVPDPDTRRAVARAVRDGGVPVEEAAKKFNISASTVMRYVDEFERTERAVREMNELEKAAVRAGCEHGARARWERRYGAAVVRAVLGEGPGTPPAG